jgi:Ca2+-binding RTX toxin-like protein
VLVVAFLIGCVVLLAVGCSGVRSGASKKELGHSPEATASKEEARCRGTRSLNRPHGTYLTNDVPGCPKGGLLRGTDGPDSLYGGDGDDTIRALGGKDHILGGPGNNVIYGGPGSEGVLDGGEGDDVIYGGDGNDWLATERSGGNLDEQRDKFYCGAGKDHYYADKNDYVDSSCEKQIKGGGGAA